MKLNASVPQSLLMNMNNVRRSHFNIKLPYSMISWGSKVGTWDPMWTGPHCLYIWLIWLLENAIRSSNLNQEILQVHGCMLRNRKGKKTTCISRSINRNHSIAKLGIEVWNTEFMSTFAWATDVQFSLAHKLHMMATWERKRNSALRRLDFFRRVFTLQGILQGLFRSRPRSQG